MFEKSQEEKIGLEPVEVKKVVAKSSIKKEEEALEKQFKELEAKLKVEKDKLKQKKKDLDLKADKKIAEVVRKWHSSSNKDVNALKDDIASILGV